MKLSLRPHIAPLARTFAISRGAKTQARTVIVELHHSGYTGRGQCVPYPRYNESVESVLAEIEASRRDIEAGIDLSGLQALMPAGAARCAVDCALWDLKAKQTGTPVWELADLPAPEPFETAVTVSLDTPEQMGVAASQITGNLLKLKLGGHDDIARLEAVHAARAKARLIIDGNEGLVPADFPAFAEKAAACGVVLIEQPFPDGDDSALESIDTPLRVCADESAHTSLDIPALAKRYDAVNVKLDKTGGFTEALKMIRAARAHDMQVMIGCMVAGSLSMAPASLLAGLADFVDLDGPLWLAEDIADGLTYKDGFVSPPSRALWG